MRKADMFAGVFLVVAGLIAIFVVIPAEIGGRSAYGLGPDFFPRLLMWLFVLFAVLLVGHRTWTAWRGRPETEGPAPMKRADWMFITGISVFLAATWQLMVHFGFVIAGIFVLGVVGVLMGSLRSNPVRLVLVTLAAPPVIFYGFKHLFLVYLPS